MTTPSTINLAIGNELPDVSEGDIGPLVAGTSLMTDQPRADESLIGERDGLVDALAQTFEELHCLRRLAGEVSASGISKDLCSIGDEFLPAIRELIKAESVSLVSEPTPQSRDSSQGRGLPQDNQPSIVWAGSQRMPPTEVLRLARHFNELSATDPIVFNRHSDLQRIHLETTANNLVAVPLTHQQSRYGWLIAIDRVTANHTDSLHDSVGHSAEFGTCDVSLLTTAATMLAGHARNIELFRAEELLRLGVIETLTGALDARDPYTCGHSRRVGQLAVQIAKQLGVTPDDCERLYITGLLHDVGKIGVPDHILLKPDKLTDEEFDVIKQHPTIGHAILSPLTALAYVLPGVLHHHERIDGRGYPHGLSGGEIPWDAKILAVADSYDAMTSNRAYRSGMPERRALEILQSGANQQWDENIVQAFLTTHVMPDELA